MSAHLILCTPHGVYLGALMKFGSLARTASCTLVERVLEMFFIHFGVESHVYPLGHHCPFCFATMIMVIAAMVFSILVQSKKLFT